MTVLGNKEIFAKNLKRYIEQSGKDRRDLADTWGFKYSTVSEWLNAKKYPRIDKIQIMADYFGIAMSDLIEEKLTEEIEKDNDILADIIVRARTDEEFNLLLKSLYPLNSEKIKGVRRMLDALDAFTQ